jgi:hypothetical protein
MAENYWGKVAELTGLQHCPKQGPFGQKDGAVIGKRHGFIVAIGPAKDENQSSINILVRFPEYSGGDAPRTVLESSTALAVALETDRVTDKHLKKLTIGPGEMLWKWEYSFGKPKAEKVAALANALADTIKGTVADFQGKCEKCRTSSVSEIMLMEGLPVCYCASCQFKLQGEADQTAREYEAIEPNLFLGLLYGAAATVVGALLWGGVAYGINRVFMWGGILIGYLVAFAVIKGMGRLNLLGQVAIGILTVLSVVLGDVMFYTLSVMKAENIPFSSELVSDIVANFWAIETSSDGGVFSMIAALAGAGFAIYTARAAKPAFTVTFTPLAPAEQANAAGMN